MPERPEIDDQLLSELGEFLTEHYDFLQARQTDSAEVAFGRYLRATRRHQGLSLHQVAQVAEVPESEILAYEHGLIPRQHIQGSALLGLAAALEEDVDDFLLVLEADLVTAPVEPIGHPWWRWLAHKVAQWMPEIRLLKLHHLAHAATLAGLLLVAVVGLEGSVPIANRPVPHTQAAGQAVAQKTQGRPMGGTLRVLSEWTFVPSSPPRATVQKGSLAGEQSFVPTPRRIIALASFAPPERISVVVEQTNSAPFTVTVRGVNESARTQSAATLTASNEPAASTALADSQTVTAAPMVTSALTVALTTGPLAHQIIPHENPICLAEKYYRNGDLHPILCQFNFGMPACGQMLRAGSTLLIPTLADLGPSDEWLDSLNGVLASDLWTEFEQITPEMVTAHQSRQPNSDYYCQDPFDGSVAFLPEVPPIP